MQEEDRIDEEIKKKKRQVLVSLFGLLLTATVAAPLSPSFPKTPVAEVTETPTSTPQPTAEIKVTATSSPEATPSPTVTAPPPLATPTATEVPATPPGPDRLPITGANAGQGLDWLALGLVALVLGFSMVGAGWVLHNTRSAQW